MAAVTQSDPAGASDWFSVTPQQWPPPPGSRVLMIAVQALSQQSSAGFLPQVQAGQPFWATAADAPNLLASSSAVIAPPGTSLRPEPPLTARGIPGIGAGTSNSSR